MHSKIYNLIKHYQDMADLELVCLKIQQTLMESDTPTAYETHRNYIEYKSRAKTFEDLLNCACKI